MAAIHSVLAGSGDGYITVFLTIAANTSNYVLNTGKVSGYVPGATNVILTINSGVTIGGSQGAAAFTVDGSWSANDRLRVVNLGSIIGAGGQGGQGGDLSGAGRTNGQPGGTALLASRAVTFDNQGTLAGGGGGGGGSGRTFGTTFGGGAGGGGGAGIPPGAGGNSYAVGSPDPALSAGAPGNTSSGGSGGYSYYGADSPYTDRGGSGGNLGQPGSPGQTSVSGETGTAPGQAGYSVVGNANISWLAVGTRLGAVV